MKSYLSIFLIIICSSLNNATVKAGEEDFLKDFIIDQEAPFYFLKPVPPAIKLPDKIDLSFFRNQSIVTEYRYRLEIPPGGATAIDRNFTRWSPWISFNFIEFIIPILDREGGYRLNVEYKSSKGGEILKFEKLFYVYRVIPGTFVEITKTETAPVSDITPSIQAQSIDKTVTKTQPVLSNTASKTKPGINLNLKRVTTSVDKIVIKPNSISFLSLNILDQRDRFPDGRKPVAQEIRGGVAQNTESILKITINGLAKETDPAKILNVKEHNLLLAESINRNDETLFNKLIRDETEIVLKGPDGGNIFHLMNDSISNDEVIAILKNKGISINQTDNNGNSPLHNAIFSGENEYAVSLINQGADLNLKNKLELSPLHLAAFLNDRQMANQLMLKGAEIDNRGNSGYTPLHIASELNHVRLAKDLLYMGANARARTNQKLTPKAIARIQNNYEMAKLISKKGAFTLELPLSNSSGTGNLRNYAEPNPKYDFSLPYDKGLLKRRQLNKIASIVSIPVFVICTVGTVYFRSEANNFFSSYKNAENIEIAKHFYNKTMQYDAFTYISGGVSLVSAFEIVHSAIRKKSISNKMRKTFY